MWLMRFFIAISDKVVAMQCSLHLNERFNLKAVVGVWDHIYVYLVYSWFKIDLFDKICFVFERQ